MKNLAVATKTATSSPGGNLFDPAKLRLSQDSAAVAGAKKALLTVPVRKPVQQSEQVKRWHRKVVRLAYRLSREKS